MDTSQGSWGSRFDGMACAAQESTLLQHTFTCGRAGPRPVRVVPDCLCLFTQSV